MSNSKLTAEVGKAVQALVNDHGEARASALVEIARPKTSPIHEAFPWDDKAAAHQHRLMVARTWIRRVTIVYEERETRLVHVPLVTRNEESSNEGVYKPAIEIVKSPGEFERALNEAIQRLHSARNAVDELRRVAEQDSSDDRSAMISQIARGLELLETALNMRTH